MKHLPKSLKLQDRESSVEQMDPEELEDFIRLAREVMQQELQERCFDKKISNSRLVQVYNTCRNDLAVKFPTRQMSSRQKKKKKFVLTDGTTFRS